MYRNEIATFFLGLIAGFFIDKLLDYILEKFKWIYKRKKLRKNIEKLDQIGEDDINVIKLANGYPYFERENIKVEILNKNLFISFPKELLNKLDEDKRESFRSDCSFNNESNFEDIVEETKIPNLLELINKHKVIVANDFINNKNGCYFNGEKYGVYEINSFERTIDEKEEPKLNIKLFNTDYFTHKVFKSIYKELKNINEIGKANLKTLKQYRAFTTSFGINGLVGVISDVSDNSVILTKRSIFATSTNNIEKHSISVIEGLTKTDYDSFSKRVDFYQCFKRGMEEELGISKDMYDEKDIRFYDLFLERNNFELGITAYVKLNDNYVYEEHLKNINGKDCLLEVSNKSVHPLNKNYLFKFIKTHEFNPQSIFTLISILAREGR